jgi:predicted nucleotide-binding protein
MSKLAQRKVFIGSSSEGLDIARKVGESLKGYNKIGSNFQLYPLVWDETNWSLNESPLKSLLGFAKGFDYGIFVFSPDDMVFSTKRDNEKKFKVRDNVLFEFGLFVSQEEGTKKSFIIRTDDNDHKLASDLQGLIIPSFKYSKDTDILRSEISSCVSKIYDAIADYEYLKVQRSENALQHSMTVLEGRLKGAKEDEKPEIIWESLKILASKKGEALNQTVSEVLQDVVLWTSSLNDTIDIVQLKRDQGKNTSEVWICSSLPIELNKSMGDLQNRFANTVLENLEKGIKYKYIVDTEEVALELITFFERYATQIDIYIFIESPILADFAFLFYQDKSSTVYLNVVRKGKTDLLIKLDKEEAEALTTKISRQFLKYKPKTEKGFCIYRK